MAGIFNKRGVGAEEWLEQIPKIILTILVLLGIIALINYYVNVGVNVESVEREVLFNRLIYSPNSIMYTDNVTGRGYPGIIDYDNFTNETLDRAITYTYEKHIAAKLELYDLQKQLIQTAYLNGIWFSRLEPLARNHIAKSAEIYQRTIPIIYRKDGIDSPGFLTVEVLIPE
jgi:hypothetical protein